MTNSVAGALAASAHFERFFPKPKGTAANSTDLDLAMDMDLVVTNVTANGGGPLTLPKPIREVLNVVDFRNPEIVAPATMPSLARAAMRYNITNGIWQGRGGAYFGRQLAFITQYKSRLDSERRMRPLARSVTFVALLTAILFPVILIYRRHRSSGDKAGK